VAILLDDGLSNELFGVLVNDRLKVLASLENVRRKFWIGAEPPKVILALSC